MKKHKEHYSYAKALVKNRFDEIHQARLEGDTFWIIAWYLFHDLIRAKTLSLHYRVECAVRGVEAVLYVR